MSDDKTIIAENTAVSALNPKGGKKKACLVQYNGTHLGKRFLIEGSEVIAGRSPECKIVVAEQSISRQHAKFLQDGVGVSIEDLGATNGTFVNDQRINQRTVLKDGDIVRFGTILFKYFSHNNIENLFHDKIYRMATIDAGTQIFNKKYLLESLDTEFQFARTYERPLSVIMYDLDFFKKVNDIHGHNAGDFILKESAQLVSTLIRKDDIFARFGGEEFCIVLPNADISVAVELAERIRIKVESHSFKFDNKVLTQTFSMGVAQLTAEMQNPLEILEAADKKLYMSKEGGRNCVTG
jgi:two-component system, cell cycle response regulator